MRPFVFGFFYANEDYNDVVPESTTHASYTPAGVPNQPDIISKVGFTSTSSCPTLLGFRVYSWVFVAESNQGFFVVLKQDRLPENTKQTFTLGPIPTSTFADFETWAGEGF